MSKTTLRDYLQTTEDAISSGRVEEALTNCQYILTHFPASLEAQRLLGEVYLAKGQLQEAQQTFDWVLTNDPENVIAYCDRALISERMEDLDTALDCYQQAYELSRGNSHIRQEFNQLSERARQPGFMFSRAGLARLYMRGDLLPQAIQEWEVILATTPDRLDARTGLLEAYWREGLYEQTEQLAIHLLEDIPGCIKALLLLAHITSSRNIHQARELVQRARALDPDLTIAQELFADIAVSQPHDPFVALIQKEPAAFPEASNGHIISAQEAATPQTTATSPFSNSLFSMSGLDALPEQLEDRQPTQESAALSTPSGNASTDVDPWATLGQQDSQARNDVSTAMPPSKHTPEAESWGTFDEITGESFETWPSPDDDPTIARDQAHLEQQSWFNQLQNEDPWGTLGSNAPAQSEDPWKTGTNETGLPTPPAWLDMLTKSEPRQSSGSIPKQPPSAPTPPEPPTAVPPTQQPEQPTTGSASTRGETAQPASSSLSQDVEDASSFGPEWLRSLGATSLNSGLPAEPPPSALPPDAPVPPVVAEPPQPAPTLSWMDELSSPSAPTWADGSTPSPSWADQLATPSMASWLEQIAPEPSVPDTAVPQALPADSIQDVVSPVAPVVSPSIQPEAIQKTPPVDAGEQHYMATLETMEQDLFSQGFTPLEPGTLSTLSHQEQPDLDLSSALAELGNLVPQANQAANPVPVQEPFATPAVTPSSAEPLWSATPTPVAPPAVIPAPPVVPEAPQIPPAQHEFPPETELETTMKRPAIRLPSVQPRTGGQPNPHTLPDKKGHPTPRPVENTGSYRERLLRGYQYQLAGAYDEAMQEYRVIIRNAPELLGEVVSNVRALLKLAPRYSAGYRILGDVYMRQGEYLQAMEAYNKALTMAKKARG
jgi:tetratricopeptide (TPR) repeat protein